MHARVVRFTDVTSEWIAQIVSELDSGEPPPGIEMTGAELFFDESQGTAVFVGYFDSEEKMQAADEIFRNMDASDTPSSRASIDLCEIRLQRQLR